MTNNEKLYVYDANLQALEKANLGSLKLEICKSIEDLFAKTKNIIFGASGNNVFQKKPNEEAQEAQERIQRVIKNRPKDSVLKLVSGSSENKEFFLCINFKKFSLSSSSK